MSNDSNRGGGSDLDIFEGLGKKSEKPAAAPPPPPGSSSHLPAARTSPIDPRKTLLGIPGPASASTSTSSSGHSSASVPASKPPPPSGSTRAATASHPPPPPGRGSLPNLGQPRRSRPPTEPPPAATAATERVPTVPPPISTRPGVRPASSPPSSSAQPAATKSANGKLEMDWDDDNEATHVYEKEKTQAKANDEKDKDKDTSADASSEVLRGPEESEPERASMDVIMSQPPRTSSQIPAAAPVEPPPVPPPPSQDPDPASLSGAFSSLGLKNGSAPPSSKVRSQPPAAGPASGSLRSVPPPPPTSQKGPSVTTQPMPPPPPPPGQTTTAPMHMPVAQRQGSTPPTANTLQSAQMPIASAPPPAQASAPPAAQASAPPPYNSAIPSAPPVPQLPPVSRAMEQTIVTRKEPSKAPLFGMLLVAVMAIAGLAVFFLMPRPGMLVINVSDTKGAAVSNLEIAVDGTKRCDSAPCIVRDISAGVHEVKVTAKGYEPPAPRAITVDKGRDVATDFQLVPSKTAAGTGFKVAAAHGSVKLSVDGTEVGVLPQEVRDLEPGEHKLRFVADRYVPLEKTIRIGKDEIMDLGTVSLKVAKGKATIQLGTPGAKVYLVNGATRKEVPQFPMAIEFDPNETWELLATKDGFDEFKEQIRFDDGQAEKTFTVTLSPKGASHPTVAAAAPAAPAPKAASAPVAAKESSSDSAKEKPAAAAKEKPTTAAAGGEAILKINSLPASSIVLDGKPIGVTPQTHVPVSPGTHTITFVNAEQSLKKTITVEVKAGETKAAFAKLRD